MKVKSILVSQPEPQAGNNPYTQLADKHKVKVDFRPFIEVVGVPAAEFRKDKVNPAEFKAFIFTSRNAIDHFFRMCEEMRVAINPEWKYFCVSEAVAFYLQKFVPYRKRKIYPGTGSLAGLIPTLKKQRGEHFLMPTSDLLNPDIPETLEKGNIKWTRATMYHTVASDLSDLSDVKYDIGGDDQRIGQVNTQVSDVTFKHVLLPVWLAAYKYRGNTYRFVVNGRTGRVQGERPYSTWKIAFAVLAGAILAVIAGFVIANSQ